MLKESVQAEVDAIVESKQIDLATVANKDLEVIAAMAHRGTITGPLADITKALYASEPLPFGGPAIKGANIEANEEEIELPAQKAVANTIEI